MSRNAIQRINHEIYCLQSEIQSLLRHGLRVGALSDSVTTNLDSLCQRINNRLADESTQYPCIISDSLTYVNIIHALQECRNNQAKSEEVIGEIGRYFLENISECRSVETGRNNNGNFYFKILNDTGYIEISSADSGNSHDPDTRITLNKVTASPVDSSAVPIAGGVPNPSKAREVVTESATEIPTVQTTRSVPKPPEVREVVTTSRTDIPSVKTTTSVPNPPEVRRAEWVAIGGRPDFRHEDGTTKTSVKESWFTTVTGVKKDQSYRIQVKCNLSRYVAQKDMYLTLPNGSTWRATSLQHIPYDDLERMCFFRLNDQLMIVYADASDYSCFTSISVRASVTVSQSFPGVSNEPTSQMITIQFQKVG